MTTEEKLNTILDTLKLCVQAYIFDDITDSADATPEDLIQLLADMDPDRYEAALTAAVMEAEEKDLMMNPDYWAYTSKEDAEKIVGHSLAVHSLDVDAEDPEL